ncbi:MAG: T9SS type A sorting domain-containing protein [Candidatus Electryonea clarkiae]|nr:T9SS type A sorting domain-containing protein [Candidatus Electryonea clarkiae]MDP8287450.1 T9SS type A sorting domain-containing protein [Candidatus Electryonea clarkiae]
MKRLMLILLATFVAFGAYAQDYVGDEACAGCHANNPVDGFYDGYKDSGHPYKLTRTGGEVPAEGTWPWTEAPGLPVAWGAQLEWSDVEFVIGNYYWKARFVTDQGYIYTGDEGETTQYNLLNDTWAGYHDGEYTGVGDDGKPYDCGRCHTTGYDAEGGNMYDMPGMVGTWTEEGIRCEACHGPAGDHVADPGNVVPTGGKDCAECHYRDSEGRNPWKGGFGRHHQQAEDHAMGSHAGLECITCHDQHRSTVYNDGGIPESFSCNNCHPGSEENGFYVVDDMEDVACIECHMSYTGKSGQTFNDYKGDVRGHFFQIMTDATTREDNVWEDESGNMFWAVDDDGKAFVTLDYSCLGCHVDLEEHNNLTLEEAVAYAVNIHTDHAASVTDSDAGTLPETFSINSVYPNPFNPTTTIEFSIDKPYITKLSVFDRLGREIAVLRDGPAMPGVYKVQFDGEGLSSGIYFVQLSTGAGSVMSKMVLMK